MFRMTRPQQLVSSQFIQPQITYIKEFRSMTTLYRQSSPQELGHGSYGSVILVQDEKTGQYFAMKIISKDLLAKYSAEENIRQEITIQSRLNHDNILKIIETFEDSANLYMVLDYCSRGNLWQIYRRKGKLTEDECFFIFYQIVLGLHYLHTKNIIHRDVKPENILLTHDNVVKICDFNWAVKIEEEGKAPPILCGTTEFMPPEVVIKQPHDLKTDIWSLGILFYVEVLHGKLPFTGENQKELINNIIGKQQFHPDKSLSQECQNLACAMVSRIMSLRPTCEEIFEFPWMKTMMQKNKIEIPFQQRKMLMSLTNQNDKSESKKEEKKVNSDVKPTKKQLQINADFKEIPLFGSIGTKFNDDKYKQQYLPIIYRAAPKN